MELTFIGQLLCQTLYVYICTLSNLVFNSDPERKILSQLYKQMGKLMLMRLSSLSKISVVNGESGRIQALFIWYILLA